jgi:hypothetical protein
MSWPVTARSKYKRKPLRIGICKQCNKEFETRRNDKIFCNNVCSCRWHNAKMRSMK